MPAKVKRRPGVALAVDLVAEGLQLRNESEAPTVYGPGGTEIEYVPSARVAAEWPSEA